MAAKKKGSKAKRSKVTSKAKRSKAKRPKARSRSKRPQARVSLDSAIEGLTASPANSILCVGRPSLATTCCDNWNTLQPPQLGEKMVRLMNDLGFGDKLDDEEKELIRRWPEHQLEAVARAIQSVCRVHQTVDPRLAKNKRPGPPAVMILMTEPDPEERPKRAPVRVVFQHPEFKMR